MVGLRFGGCAGQANESIGDPSPVLVEEPSSAESPERRKLRARRVRPLGAAGLSGCAKKRRCYTGAALREDARAAKGSGL